MKNAPVMRTGCWEGRFNPYQHEERWLPSTLGDLLPEEMRVDLKVPFSQKDEAKKLGARWDSARKTWYVENVEHIGRFLQWVPDHLRKPHVEKIR